MSSEVLLVVAGIISLAVSMIGWWSIFPVLFELNEGDRCQSAFNINSAIICQRTYEMMRLLPGVVVGGIFLSLFIRASRKQVDEFAE